MQDPSCLHLLWAHTRIVRKGNHEMSHTETQMSIMPQYQWTCRSFCTAASGAQTERMQPLSNRDQEHHKYYTSYILHKEVILHPAQQCITVRYRKSNGLRCGLRMVHHPRTGWNLLMTGDDLLGGGTETPVVSRRSDGGQVTLYQRRHMWVWYVVCCDNMWVWGVFLHVVRSLLDRSPWLGVIHHHCF